MGEIGENPAVAGSGSIPAGEKVDSRTIFDLSANYRLTRNAKPFAEMKNLTDETGVDGIRQAGLCVGRSRTAMVGAQLDF